MEQEKGIADEDMNVMPERVGPLVAQPRGRRMGTQAGTNFGPATMGPGPMNYPQYFPGPSYYPFPAPYYGSPRASYHRGRYQESPHSHDTNPSSELEDQEDPMLFPRIQTWLESLDAGPLGADGHNFSQYGASLVAQGYTRISQLADLVTIADLMRHCPNIVEGTGRLIFNQAGKAVAKIRRQEKRQRKQKKRRYD